MSTVEEQLAQALHDLALAREQARSADEDARAADEDAVRFEKRMKEAVKANKALDRTVKDLQEQLAAVTAERDQLRSAASTQHHEPSQAATDSPEYLALLHRLEGLQQDSAKQLSKFETELADLRTKLEHERAEKSKLQVLLILSECIVHHTCLVSRARFCKHKRKSRSSISKLGNCAKTRKSSRTASR
jgi:hypothetical protein